MTPTRAELKDHQLTVARSRLLELNRGIWNSYDSSLDGSIHHYTSVAAFGGLVRSGAFWLSDMTTMNDDREFIYFTDVLRPIIARKSVSPEAKERLLRTPDMFSFGSRWFGYTMCFCRAADKPAQWERYGDSGRGVAISFNYQKLIEGGANFNYSLVRVVYDREFQAEAADRLIDGAIHLGRELGIRKCDQLEFWFEVMLFLFGCAARSKDSQFKSEEEVRIVLLSTDRTDAKTREGENGVIRHYVEAPIPFAALNGVAMGPRAQVSEAEVRDILGAKGLDAPVLRSQVLLP